MVNESNPSGGREFPGHRFIATSEIVPSLHLGLERDTNVFEYPYGLRMKDGFLL